MAVDLSEEFIILEKLFEGVSLIGDYSKKIKDQILSKGELLSAKLLTAILIEKEFMLVLPIRVN
jgi:aspartokinase/homoserine dehydrogenase 1